MNRLARITGLLSAVALLGTGAPAFSQVIPGWYSTTDLSFVATEGNTKTMNAGLTSNLTRKWLRTEWITTASFVYTGAAEPTRLAVGTPTSFDESVGDRQTKAEKYFLNSNLKRRVTERFFWNVGGSGERDKFAGLNSRLTGVVGVGYIFTSPTSGNSFTAGVGGTYTAQDEVVDDPETENQFAGIRFTADGEARFGTEKQNAYTSNLVVDENLQDTDDLRFNWQNAIAVEMNQRLALKLGAQVAYDHQPQLIDIPLILPNGADGGQVAGRADELDLAITMSIVINIRPGQRTQ